MSIRQLMCVCVFTLLLSGCVHMPTPIGSKNYTVLSPQVRFQALRKIGRWKTNGAFSVVQNHKAQIAHFAWQQFPNHRYHIQISSALALYQLQLIGRTGSVSLVQSGHKTLRAKTPEQLMQKVLGWYLPIRPLRYWYRGLPAPKTMGAYTAKYDRYGHLIGLDQAGWQLHFSAYLHIKQYVDLPQVLTLKRPGLSIKVVTKRWGVSRRTH